MAKTVKKKQTIKTIEDPLFPEREWIEIHDVPVSFLRQNTYLYQQRENMLQWVVDEYADIYKTRGIDALPPLECVQIDGNHGGCLYVLTDGHHRFEAVKKAGLDTVTIRFRAGTPDDAVWQSIAANKTNGLHRTNADKRKAILNALLHARGQVMSDRAIADYVGCSDKLIAAVRRDHPSLFPDSQTERIGRDGKKRKPTSKKENTNDDDDQNQNEAGTSQNNEVETNDQTAQQTGNKLCPCEQRDSSGFVTANDEIAATETSEQYRHDVLQSDDSTPLKTRAEISLPPKTEAEIDEIADDINGDIFYTFTRLEEYGLRIELELIHKQGIRTNDTVEAIIYDANDVIVDRRSYDLKPNTLTLVEI